MSERHTPGPWERLIGFAEPGHPIYEPDKLVIRIVQKREPGQVEFNKIALVDSGAENAALIAAAPTMREALIETQLMFGFMKSVIQSGEAWSTTCQESYDKACAKIDAALSLARGETDNG